MLYEVITIGKALSEAEAMNLTQPGFLVGTPAYVSPERLFGDGEDDGRGDRNNFV